MSRRDFLLTIVSAVLLIFAFPCTDWWRLAWVGFVPLLFVIDGKKPSQAFGLAYLCGLIFFFGTLYWFWHVTLLGMILLVMYFAVYFGCFGALAVRFGGRSILSRIFILPIFWVSLELIRSRLFTGFDWVSLGHSQYKIFYLIQIADLTGVFGISFLVMMGNVLVKEIISGGIHKNTRGLGWPVVIFAGIFMAVFFYGRPHSVMTRLSSSVIVSVVQPQIKQTLKWVEATWPDILRELKLLTLKAAADRPGLIVWPETAFPGILEKSAAGDFRDPGQWIDEVRAIARAVHVPLLFGAVIEEDGRYFNAALLMDEQGNIKEVYRKRHLVAFGEYVPLRRFWPALAKFVPIEDFTSGKNWTVFSLGDPQYPRLRFSSLICFEDTVARVTRQFVLSDADVLINMTNDAWFGRSKAMFLHLQSAVFRAVENRKPLIRAANTGVSAFIADDGSIEETLPDFASLRNDHPGVMTRIVSYQRGKPTLYSRWGDWFAWAGFLFSLAIIGFGLKFKK
ncbi:MAG: apolipoprotein N-acyltransferase [Candidatus Omnitrophica bacterium]|nr:apolipoprotein N-acyltransferase [Candidatus Omnitrophota bacterium]